MNDVFISYSRKDKEFVGRLRSALSELNRDVWVDWEDIPLTADWWQEICAGIESADTFIFIMTPDSLASPICMLEVAHATHHNKRLVPVMRGQVDEAKMIEALGARKLDDNTLKTLAGRDLLTIARENWQHLSRHNWLFFQNDDEFPQNFKALITAVDTDLEHVKTHTRLVVRAGEWDKNNRNPSYLLSGEDLSRAESWLAQSGGHSPLPTDLQIQYLHASRAAAAHRQRVLLGGVSVALIVAIALTVLSLILARQAEFARSIAADNAGTATVALGQSEVNLRQARESQSLFLASLSGDEFERGNARQAFLLAQEGLQYYPDVYNPENVQALADAVTAPGLERYAIFDDNIRQLMWDNNHTRYLFYGHDVHVYEESGKRLFDLPHANEVTSSSWSPSGDVIATGMDNVVFLWDANTGELLHTLYQNYITLSLKWTADGTYLYSPSSDGTWIWEVSGGTLVKHIPAFINSTVGSIGIGNPAIDNFDTVVLWDLSTGQQLYRLESALFPVMSADQSQLVMVDQEGMIYFWNFETAQVERTLSIGSPVDGFRLDGQNLVAWKPLPDGKSSLITVTDLTTDETIGYNIEIPVEGIFLKGEYFVSYGSDTNALLWKLGSRRFLFEVTRTPGIPLIEWSPDGKYIATWGTEPVVEIYDIEGQGQLFNIPAGGSPDRVRWSGSMLMFNIPGQGVRVWDIDTGLELFRFNIHGGLIDLDWRDNRLLTVTDRAVQMWQTWPESFWIHLWKNRYGVADVQWNAGESKMLALSRRIINRREYAGEVNLWEGDTLARTFTMSEVIDQMALNPVGDRLLTALSRGQVTLWDVDTGESLTTFELGSYIQTITWNSDGTRFAIWSNNGQNTEKTLTIGDSQTGETLYGLTEPESNDVASGGVRWNPDNIHLAAWDNDGDVIIWDSATGETGARLQHDDVLSNVVWNHAGTQLLTGVSGTYRLWDATSGELLREYQPLESAPDEFVVDLDAQWKPDDSGFAVSFSDGRIAVYDTSVSELEKVFGGQGDIIFSFAWNQAGNRLLVASHDGALRIWDIESGQATLTVRHRDSVVTAYWSNDESLILSASWDGSAAIWDAATGQPVMQFNTNAPLAGAAWNADESRVITWGDDGTIREWRYDFEQMFTESKNVVVRPLTTEERVQYFIASPLDQITATPPEPTITVTPPPTMTPGVMSTDQITPSPTGETVVAQYPDFDTVDINPHQAVEILTNYGLIPQTGNLALDRLAYSFDLTDLDNDIQTAALVGNYRNFMLFGHLNWGRGAASDYCGIRFREQDGAFYEIELSRLLNSSLLFNKMLDGEYVTDGRGIFAVENVLNFSGDNRLLIVVHESRVMVFINGQYVTQYTDTDLSDSGMISVYSGTLEDSDRSGCSFNGVWLWDLDGTPENSRPDKAEIGDNRGEIAVGEADEWALMGKEGEIWNISVSADNPANTAFDREDLLDTHLLIFEPDGDLLVQSDDIDAGVLTDSAVTNLELSEDGLYRIEVRGYNLETGGAYTLTLEKK